MKKFMHSLTALTIAAIVAWGLAPAQSLAEAKSPAPALAKLAQACQEARRSGCLGEAVQLTPQGVVKLAAGPCPQVRGVAIYTLGEMRDPLAVEALIGMLGDPDRHLRQAAARALGKIGHKQAVSSLIAVLSDPDENLMVRCSAAWALGNMGDQRALHALQSTAATAQGRLRVVCGQAVSQYQDIRAEAPGSRL